jgi:hypothetical protein
MTCSGVRDDGTPSVPMLVGSVSDKYREDAERHLEKWLKHLKPEETSNSKAELPISLEIALAQGFKAEANRRARNPHTCPEARAYLVQRAEEMLKYARFWFTQLTLIHALCLWALPDDTGTLVAGPEAFRHDGRGRRKGPRERG